MFRLYSFALIIGFFSLVTACNRHPEFIKFPSANELITSSQMANSLYGARVLVFSKTKGARHDSIAAGIETFKALSANENFSIITSEDANVFNDIDLQQFNAIVFLNTSCDLLNSDQEVALERYIQAGGGFLGIHAAADIEQKGEWFWYRNLVGAIINRNSNQIDSLQPALLKTTQKSNLLLTEIPNELSIVDSWYDYYYEYPNLQILQEVYNGEDGNKHHPVTWAHEYDGGRAFYTGLGHGAEIFHKKHFKQLLINGLKYVVAKNYRSNSSPQLNYKLSRPESNRFVKKVLASNLDEPVKFAFFPNGDALIALRPGKLARMDYKTNKLFDAGEVHTTTLSNFEFGLIGVAIDPEFPRKPYIYIVYSVQDKNGQVSQHLARFNWQNDRIDSSSEKTILQYPADKNCCHTGGDLHFSKNRELFFSTGDNTEPGNDYSPMDFREGAFQRDALRSAGNTQDLRGKILRIRINDDGSYSIPNGNLFKNLTDGRPEIYVMGARNPYSITLDTKTNNLFFGDVGPDANSASDEKGPRGYDEVNRVTQAGNFGWPLVVGRNQPYKYYDYVNQKSGEWIDTDAPKNHSPHNTGAIDLPPAQPSWIAYPYAVSEEFPELGDGGRVALVADVYHAENYPPSQRYPSYYNNKLFMLDFVRGWIKTVSFNPSSGEIFKIESFAPQIKYSSPIAAHFAPDGNLYLLEYGMSVGAHNADARLTRIEYVGASNRPPVAKINLDKTQVAIATELVADAHGSKDPDGDKLTYEWHLACTDHQCPEKKLDKDVLQPVNINNPGRYQLQLKVTDTQGLSNSDQIELDIGNESAQIAMITPQNSQFYWPDTKGFSYQINIQDKEDGHVIMNQAVDNPLVTFSSITSGKSAEGQSQSDLINEGKALVDANNCLSCHSLDVKKVGPAYKAVADKYKNDPNAIEYLINKIGKGGKGVWGDMNMPAFSTLSEGSRRALATYVLSLTDNKIKSLPLTGYAALQVFDEQKPMNYQLSVEYKDNAQGSVPSISVKKVFDLQPAKQSLANYLQDTDLNPSLERASFNNQNLVKFEALGEPIGFTIGKIDLRQVRSVRLKAFSASDTTDWSFELRENNAQGAIIATGHSAAKNQTLLDISANLEHSKDNIFSLYIAVKSAEKDHGYLFVGNIEFEK